MKPTTAVAKKTKRCTSWSRHGSCLEPAVIEIEVTSSRGKSHWQPRCPKHAPGPLEGRNTRPIGGGQ